MWACDVVPWVSWGTIAFITWIYEQLLDSINAFDLKALKLFFSLKWKTLWHKINGWFLFTLMFGIFVAIISLAKLIQFMIATQPVIIRSLFLGLLMASIIVVAKHVPKRSMRLVSLTIAWAIFWYIGTSLPLTQLEPTMWSTFGAWMIAIMAMILPWISGSYILLMLNHYQHIINNLVATVDWVKEAIMLVFNNQWLWAWDHLWTLPRDILWVFIAGAFIWIIFFVKLLHWIKSHYHDQLIAVLIWIMLWALHKVWPRKEVISTYVDRHWETKTLLETNIIPSTLSSFFTWIAFMLLWIWLIVVIQYFANKNHRWKTL